MRKMLGSTLLCLILAVSMSGCFGKFALTRKIYEFNEGISGNQFVRSAVTWGMIIIPVYEVGALVDFVALNTLEFWTGSNPVTANAQCDGTAHLAAVEQADGSVVVQRGGIAYRLVPNGAGSFVIEQDGVRVGSATTTEEGGLVVTNAESHVIAALTAAEVQARAANASL